MTSVISPEQAKKLGLDEGQDYSAGVLVGGGDKRTYSVGLHGADGATLRITARRRGDGTVVTRATHTTRGADGKRKNASGATETHASMDDAKSAVARLAREAEKLGWFKKGGAFRAKADAFDAKHLPSPADARAPKGSKK